MNALISKGDHSTEFHLGAVFSTRFYLLLILIINPNDYAVFVYAICACGNGHIYNWHRNKWIGVKQILVLSVLTLGSESLVVLNVRSGRAHLQGLCQDGATPCWPGEGAGPSGGGRMNYLTSEGPFHPGCAVNWPRCVFGQAPSWRSTPLDLGIERDFLVHIGLVGFRKALYDCVILATTVSWSGDWGQVWQ